MRFFFKTNIYRARNGVSSLEFGRKSNRHGATRRSLGAQRFLFCPVTISVRHVVANGPKLPKWVEFAPNLVDVAPELVEFAKVCPKSLVFAGNWQNIAQKLAIFARNRPKSLRTWRNSAQTWPFSPETGRNRSTFGRFRPKLSKIAPKLVNIAQHLPKSRNSAGWGQILTDEVRISPTKKPGPDPNFDRSTKLAPPRGAKVPI